MNDIPQSRLRRNVFKIAAVVFAIITILSLVVSLIYPFLTR